MAMTRNTRSVRRIKVARSCYYCDKKSPPDYKDVGSLTKFLSERGKILSHAKTGICSTHQRALSDAIKYARHIAFLPFIIRV